MTVEEEHVLEEEEEESDIVCKGNGLEITWGLLS